MISVTSSAFQNYGMIPDQYGCNGSGINPPISLLSLPDKTVSIALTIIDPDSPSGHFAHWVVFNIDPSVQRIEENSLPFGGVQGKNDFGHNAYGGPCPSFGTHHYHFAAYALDCKLPLYAGAKKSQLDQAMEGHILDQGELVGTYSKK